jgi:hypothetical protein
MDSDDWLPRRVVAIPIHPNQVMSKEACCRATRYSTVSLSTRLVSMLSMVKVAGSGDKVARTKLFGKATCIPESFAFALLHYKNGYPNWGAGVDVQSINQSMNQPVTCIVGGKARQVMALVN